MSGAGEFTPAHAEVIRIAKKIMAAVDGETAPAAVAALCTAIGGILGDVDGPLADFVDDCGDVVRAYVDTTNAGMVRRQ
jgi:hypothetical protein